MTKLNFSQKKKNNFKKIYSLRLINSKKPTKFNNSINLGNYISNVKLYTFIYPKINFYSKLGVNLSKQFILISLFYLKNFLNKNIN